MKESNRADGGGIGKRRGRRGTRKQGEEVEELSVEKGWRKGKEWWEGKGTKRREREEQGGNTQTLRLRAVQGRMRGSGE